MADVGTDIVTNALRDALYVGVGAGLLTFQRLQVQRVELTRALASQLAEARGSAQGSVDSVSGLVEDRVRLLEDRLEIVEGRLESVLTQIEGRLPVHARGLVRQARDLMARAA